MKVRKRNGTIEPFTVEKTRGQTEFAVHGTNIPPIEFESSIHFPQKDTITSDDIQKTIISTAVNKISVDEPEWNYVAGRANMFNLYRHIYKNTKHDVKNWEDHIKYLIRNDYYRSDIGEYLDNLTTKQKRKIDNIINSVNASKNYDFSMVFAQVEVLKTKYLIKNKRGIIEYPILSDIANALILSKGDETFDKIFYYIHNQYISLASPFKRNLRRPNGNVGSCFIGENIDSLTGLAKSWADMANISKNGGGIGWYLGKVRPEDTWSYSVVKANNIAKWVKIINDIAVAVNQGGQRPGAITLGLDWWHMDIESFLDIKSELNGDLRDKAFDIFPQIIVDSFFVKMKKAKKDVWLFNQYEYLQKTGKDITELVGDELQEAILEAQDMAEKGTISGKKVNANELWKKVMWTWIEIGDLFITHKDNLNKSNYLKYDPEGGITKQGNLCVESFSLSKAPTKWKEEVDGRIRKTTETNGWYHSCNLCSIVVTNLVNASDELIEDVCYHTTLILDKSIDEGEMPVLEAKKSSDAIRNIGIGVVGMGDLMAYNNKMYDTEDGQKFGEKFVEKISWYCYNASVKLAEQFEPYPMFKPENYDKILGYDPKELNKMSLNGYDWTKLQKDIKEKGIRNFYLLAFAPNSTTGVMMNAVASYLPVYNKEMYQTFGDMSVPIIPKFIKSKYWSYKTKFQYHPKDIIKFTRGIQRWVDTGCSMEINMSPETVKINEVSDAIIEGFESGELKTVYYSMSAEGCSDCSN